MLIQFISTIFMTDSSGSRQWWSGYRGCLPRPLGLGVCRSPRGSREWPTTTCVSVTTIRLVDRYGGLSGQNTLLYKSSTYSKQHIKTNVCLCATNKTNLKRTQLWHWTTTVVLWQWVLVRGNTAYPLFVLKCPHSVTVQQSHKLSWVKVTTGLQHNTFLISNLQRLRIHYFSAFQCLKFHHKIQEY